MWKTNWMSAILGVSIGFCISHLMFSDIDSLDFIGYIGVFCSMVALIVGSFLNDKDKVTQ